MTRIASEPQRMDVQYPAGAGAILFTKSYMVPWVNTSLYSALIRGCSCPEAKAHLHEVTTLEVRGVTPSLPYMLLWRCA